jgi:hypothetical protein
LTLTVRASSVGKQLKLHKKTNTQLFKEMLKGQKKQHDAKGTTVGKPGVQKTLLICLINIHNFRNSDCFLVDRSIKFKKPD